MISLKHADYVVLFRKEWEKLEIVKNESPEYFDFIDAGYKTVYYGTKKECWEYTYQNELVI